MTTGIFLILLGSLLEYSSKADLVVYIIGLSVASLKIINGLYIIINGREVGEGVFDQINKLLPCELFFAVANSIKYVIVVYVAKWVNKSALLGMVGIMFTILGMTNWIKFLYFDNIDNMDTVEKL